MRSLSMDLSSEQSATALLPPACRWSTFGRDGVSHANTWTGSWPSWPRCIQKLPSIGWVASLTCVICTTEATYLGLLLLIYPNVVAEKESSLPCYMLLRVVDDQLDVHNFALVTLTMVLERYCNSMPRRFNRQYSNIVYGVRQWRASIVVQWRHNGVSP